MKVQTITLQEVEYTAYLLAKEFMTWDEPIPAFGTRFPNILESCLKVPFQTFGGKGLYRGLVSKAAILFYLLIKNHPFQNGNKRIAIMALLVLLHKNGKWLRVDNDTLYRFARSIAASDPTEMNLELGKIRDFFRTYLIKLER